MGLPPLPPTGGDTVRATRFITLEERLAGHVHAMTPRVTPGRLTRESFDTAPLQTHEYAADKHKDDASPLRQARVLTQASVTTANTLRRAVPRMIGVDVADVDVRGQDVVASS
jgi:hypothetical protein